MSKLMEGNGRVALYIIIAILIIGFIIGLVKKAIKLVIIFGIIIAALTIYGSIKDKPNNTTAGLCGVSIQIQQENNTY